MNESIKPLAVVTGASSGIGYELACQFARNGFDLIVAAEEPGIADVTRALEELGAAATSVQVDLSSYDGVERLYATIKSTGLPVDAVAINAGVGVSGDFARDTDLEAELKLISLNVTSAVHLAKRVLQDMVPRGAGRILFTSSVAATMPGPYMAAYAASKAFLYSFAEAIRHELRDTGVTITALLPGPTATEFFERADMQDTKIASMEKDDPADVARQGFEALMAGKDHIVAGSLKNKAQAVAAKTLPEPAKAKMHGRLAEPGSGD
ncbi:MAG TPA: SDR family NAD(P)-dependent oxidoreductase [Actinomadura sp.]|jgi:short-subunit dehydrogenase|nr:SDR family NAD(P)-dependent oxidoreductase [Actinomadura sp.]